MMYCVNLRTGKKLPCYRTKAVAKQAEKAAKKKGHRLIAYQCSNCDQWHLAPRKHHRRDCELGCYSKGGNPKKCYRSKEEARVTADLISLRRNQEMWVYPCPYDPDVWHISSQAEATSKEEKARKKRKRRRSKSRRTRRGPTRRS